MAEPITEVVDPEADRALLREWEALWAVPGRSEAVGRTLDLLRALDERGLLDAGRAVLEGNPAASHAVTEFLAQSQQLRVARNVRAVFELLATVDLGSLAGARRPSGAPVRPMGLLELRRRLRDPDVSAGLALVLDALARLGRSRTGAVPPPPRAR